MLFFEWDNELIFKLDDIINNYVFLDRRLCVSKVVNKYFFETAYFDEYINYIKIYNIIFKHWYIKKLTRKLKDYLRYCLKC